jgi:RNA polymerase sigma-70 factor (ECF subfamily)
MPVSRCRPNETAHEPIARPGGFPVEPPGFFGYIVSVFSLSPTFVERKFPDTQSLLQEAQSGDAEAFGELCEVYETPLLRQAMTLCGNVTLSEDLAQDTLVEAWRCLRRYNGRCQFFTWLCAILLNRYRNTLRASRRLQLAAPVGHEQDGSPENLENLPDRGCQPDESAQLHEQAAALRTCIQALPPKHQQVIYLRFYVDDSLDGIAAALGCPPGTVKSRLYQALEKLRRMNLVAAETSALKQKTENL